MKVTRLDSGSDLSEAFAIREKVFNGEDGIPTESDLDGLDATAEQFMAYDEGRPIGTARYRRLDDGSAKVERVAVLPEYRGKGIGKLIMADIEDTAFKKGIHKIVLSSKVSSKPFYLKLGYSPVGEEFEDVGLPHIKMVKELK